MLLRMSALSISLLAYCTAPLLGQVELAWKLKAGSEFYVETVTDSEQSMEALGREGRQTTEQTLVLGFTVREKTEQGWILEERFEQLKVAVGGQTFEEKFSKAINLRDDKLKAGPGLRITLNNKLKIMRVESLDGAGKPAVAGSVTGSIAVKAAADPLDSFYNRLAGDDSELRKRVQLLVNEEVLKRGVREVFGGLPDKPVKRDDAWPLSNGAEPLGPLGTWKRTTKYKYEGTVSEDQKQVEKITFTGSVVFEPADGAKTLPFKIVKADLKTDSIKGTIYFDNKAGRLVKSETKMTLEGPLTIDFSPDRLECKMKHITTVKTRLLDKKP